MPKDLNNKPRRKDEIPVNEGPIINPIKAPADNPGEIAPKRKGACPSGGRRR